MPSSPTNSSLAYQNYFLKSSSAANLFANKYVNVNSSISRSPKPLEINYLAPGKTDLKYALNSPKISTENKKENTDSILPYTNLKNKIDTIAGKLQEIKKDYEISQKERR